MSSLTENLQQIYSIKQEIKEAIGTSSDIFSDYPAYISAMAGGITPAGYAYVTSNGDYDVSTYAMVNVNVPTGSGETIAQKNVAWQTKWVTALSTMAAGLYAQDSAYGEPQISDPSGWCIQTAIDGDAAMSEMIAMHCLWMEIYGGVGKRASMLHTQYVQIFTQMGLTIDNDGYLVSTDHDKLIPFDVDEAVVSNWTGVCGQGTMGGKKISSLNGGIENAKWDYYGPVFNSSGFYYVYLGQFDYVVNQGAMLQKMNADGVTFVNDIPAVNQTTLVNYLNAFQIDEYTPYKTMNITANGTFDVTSYASAYVSVSGGGSGGTFDYDIYYSDVYLFNEISYSMFDLSNYLQNKPYENSWTSKNMQTVIEGTNYIHQGFYTIPLGDIDLTTHFSGMSPDSTGYGENCQLKIYDDSNYEQSSPYVNSLFDFTTGEQWSHIQYQNNSGSGQYIKFARVPMTWESMGSQWSVDISGETEINSMPIVETYKNPYSPTGYSNSVAYNGTYMFLEDGEYINLYLHWVPGDMGDPYRAEVYSGIGDPSNVQPMQWYNIENTNFGKINFIEYDAQNWPPQA